MALQDSDIMALGPCFTNVSHLIWYMNMFNEAAYDAYIEPYFSHIEFENDDGWYPGCEIWGDGQMTQDKNSHNYY